MKRKIIVGIIGLISLLGVSFVGCSNEDVAMVQAAKSSTLMNETSTGSDSLGSISTIVLSSVEGSLLDASELFSERDLEQSADLAVLSISEMGHFLNRTLLDNQAALASSLMAWL